MKRTPIRVGLWGIGRAGHNMHCQEMDQFPDRFRIVAACDTDESKVRNLVDRYHCAGYTNGAEFLKDPNVELVSIAVRSTEHVDYALKALKAGKIVFLEKPFALAPEGLKKLEEAVKEYPGRLYFRHNRRFEAAFNHPINSAGATHRYSKLSGRKKCDGYGVSAAIAYKRLPERGISRARRYNFGLNSWFTTANLRKLETISK